MSSPRARDRARKTEDGQVARAKARSWTDADGNTYQKRARGQKDGEGNARAARQGRKLDADGNVVARKWDHGRKNADGDWGRRTVTQRQLANGNQATKVRTRRHRN